MTIPKYTIGADFGSDSVRCLVVSVDDGREIAAAVENYPRWSRGEYCLPSENQYRQHPLDYIEAFTSVVRKALESCPKDVVENIVGISFDTTASTPVLVDADGTPLALLPEFAQEPDAMFVLWKDHTAIAEADEINALAHSWEVDYTKYSGGIYSCEWSWAKVLHIIRRNEKVRQAAVSWTEHCDWISGLLVGNVSPQTIARSRCVAGHKAMWHAEWGGLPAKEFLARLDVKLAEMRDMLYSETYTADHCVGRLSAEWAEKLGLSEKVAVGIGAIDCHIGAVGAGIRPNMQVKVMGTSTCDIIIAPQEQVGDRTVKGICGQVDGSVVPGAIGFEAGQSAFGDVYAWFRRLLAWTLDGSGGKEIEILSRLTEEAAKLPLTSKGVLATDWFNGRRTPDADPNKKASIVNLTMATTAPEIFKALVEATAFGSRAINERMLEEGVRIDEIIAVGGVSRKSAYVMQTMADVIGMPIKVAHSEQACALGAAMYAAVVAGAHETIYDAMNAMASGYDATYAPDAERHETYNRLYAEYIKLR